MPTISDALRAAITRAPSRYAISKATGVDQATLSRFLHGTADMRLATVDVLADHLGLELRPRGKSTTKKTRRTK